MSFAVVMASKRAGRMAATRGGGSTLFRHQGLLRQEQFFSASTTNPLGWIWNQVKVPKGFENFFPKGGAKQKPPPVSKKTTDKKAGQKSSKQPNDSDKKSSHQKKQGNTGGFGGTPFVNNNNNNSNNKESRLLASAALLALLGYTAYQTSNLNDSSAKSKEITWQDMYPLLHQDQVEKIVVVNKNMARVVLKEGAPGLTDASTGSVENHATDEWSDDTWNTTTSTTTSHPGSSSSSSSRSANAAPHYHFYIGSVESLEEKLAKAQEMKSPREQVSVQYISETNVGIELIKLIPSMLLLGGIVYVTRNAMSAAGGGGRGGPGGIFQVGKSNAKKIGKEDVDVTFADVAGCAEAKKEIMEFVDFLQDSSRFTKLGAKIPKGALLCGPPGTGKTLLAKAVAGEASVPFYSISGSDFIEMFVGVGPSRVRDLFKEARENAPCIIFIDEIDAVGRQRGRGGFSGGNDERENTLNQLLVEMDGFAPTTGVVVLAGTNRVDILDQALTRPGRFDRQITVDKPDINGRKEIFLVHLKGITLEDEPDEIAGRLAGLTPGFAGADIANICNEAAIVAARRKGEAVSMDDFEKATDRIIGGLESNKIMSKEERSIVAHHEAGHAIAGWFLEHADPLLKVTIIPRSSGALGYAQYLPKEVFLRTEDQIMDIVCMALAGRAAEEVFFGNVTTGASDDLRRVTQLVYSTIQQYGMNSRVGQMAFPQDPNAGPGDKPYSDATAKAMDEEARAIVDAAYERTLELIRERKEQVEKVANLLLEKETITHDDIVELVGHRPFEPDKQYQDFVSRHQPRQKSSEMEEAIPDPGDDNPTLTPGLA
jgi:AFG3 family protein